MWTKMGSIFLLPASMTPTPVFATKGGSGPEAIKPEKWVANSDYPSNELRMNRLGTVTFTLSIDQRGVPIRCEILSSSGSPALDQRSCALIFSRGRYKPALDEASTPVASSVVMRIHWKIPGEEYRFTRLDDWDDVVLSVTRLRQGTEARVRVRQLVEPDGKVTTCAVEQASIPALDKLACQQVAKLAKPAKDLSGNLLRTMQMLRVAFVTQVPPKVAPANGGATYVRDGMPSQ